MNVSDKQPDQAADSVSGREPRSLEEAPSPESWPRSTRPMPPRVRGAKSKRGQGTAPLGGRSLGFLVVIATTCVLLPALASAQAPPVKKADVGLETSELSRVMAIEAEIDAARKLLSRPDRTSEDYVTAKDHLERAIALDQGRAQTYHDVGMIYLNQIDASQSWVYFETYLELARERDSQWALVHEHFADRILYSWHWKYGQSGPPTHELDEAEGHLLAAYEVMRDHGNIVEMAKLEQGLALVALYRRDIDARLRYLRAAIDHDVGHSNTFGLTLRLARALVHAGRAEEALEVVEGMDMLGPDHRYRLDRGVVLASAHRELGHIDTALQYLDILAEDIERQREQRAALRVGPQGGRSQLDDDLALIEQERATVYVAATEFETAVEHFRAAYELTPGGATAKNNLAWGLALASDVGDPRLDEAERLVRDAIAENPSPAYLDTLGEVLIRQQRFDEALGAIDEALTLRPDDPYLLSQRRRVERARAGHPVEPGQIRSYRRWLPPSNAML